MTKEDATSSPCIRNCCLDDNDICLGCFRHIDEIVNWNQRSNPEKKTILQHCKERQQQRPTHN